MYSQFFRHNSAIQAELDLHRNYKSADNIGRALHRNLHLEGSAKQFGLKEQKMVESILQPKLAMMYQVEESVNHLGPKHIGDINSWWNSNILEDESQFRPTGAQLEELFPMKDWTKYRCLGPLQMTKVSEQLMRRELFNVPARFERVKQDVRNYLQQVEFEERLARDRLMSTVSYRGVSLYRTGRSTHRSIGQNEVEEEDIKSEASHGRAMEPNKSHRKQPAAVASGLDEEEDARKQRSLFFAGPSGDSPGHDGSKRLLTKEGELSSTGRFINRRIDAAFSDINRPEASNKPNGRSGVPSGPAFLLPPSKAAGEGDLSEEADASSRGEEKHPGQVANAHPAMNLRQRFAKAANGGSTIKLIRDQPDEESQIGFDSSADAVDNEGVAPDASARSTSKKPFAHLVANKRQLFQ